MFSTLTPFKLILTPSATTLQCPHFIFPQTKPHNKYAHILFLFYANLKYLASLSSCINHNYLSFRNYLASHATLSFRLSLRNHATIRTLASAPLYQLSTQILHQETLHLQNMAKPGNSAKPGPLVPRGCDCFVGLPSGRRTLHRTLHCRFRDRRPIPKL
jgi:hypothetical protein